MPYAKNGDINIYYEVEGEGPPLVLLPSGSRVLEDWRELGYTEPLKKDYQLILMDVRGRGKSDKPHVSEAYDMEYRVTDVTTVLDELRINSAHFFGYSYGGRICLECAKLVPERVRSLIIGGMGPMGKSIDESNPVLQRLEGGRDAYIASLEQSGPLSPERKAQLLASDHEAAMALLKSPWPNLKEDLPYMTMPILILFGENDSLWPPKEVKTSFNTLPDMTFITIAGVDHLQALERIDMALPHITGFLSRVTK